jgi:hypothetical protein
VFSWDNLTNKGLVHEIPEVVLVWNVSQAKEAVELQDIPRGRVRVLGAWSYDHWFDWQPSTSREEFCARVGLRADRPIALYVCSSGFVARDEVAFVRRWLAGLRTRESEAGVIVRPHPRNAAQWAGVELDDPQAVVWPKLGEEPLESESRKNYFDSIYHSAAVVGINTSAQIESAVVGRPVHTVLADEFKETQQGTLHFQYLKDGHLWVGQTLVRSKLFGCPGRLGGLGGPHQRVRQGAPLVSRRHGNAARRDLEGSAQARQAGAANALLRRRTLTGCRRGGSAPPREQRARRIRRAAGGAPESEARRGEVVAGPWSGEVELYWIRSCADDRDAAAPSDVVARASSAAWYEDRLDHADAADFEESRRFHRSCRAARWSPPEGAVLAAPPRSGGAADGAVAPRPRAIEAVLALLEGRRAIVEAPPPERGHLIDVHRAASRRLRRSHGSRDPTLGAAGRRYAALVRQRLEHLVPVSDPLVLCSQIQRSGGAAQPALRRNRNARIHEIRWLRERRTGRRSISTGRMVRAPVREEGADTSSRATKRGAKLVITLVRRPFLFLRGCGRRSSTARLRDLRARRARRLLHFVLQRLARQPGLHGRRRSSPAARGWRWTRKPRWSRRVSDGTLVAIVRGRGRGTGRGQVQRRRPDAESSHGTSLEPSWPAKTNGLSSSRTSVWSRARKR